MIKYIDSHTHLQFAAYNDDRDEVASRAQENNVACINVGTQIDTSKDAIKLSEKYKDFFATVGLHPIHTSKSYHDAKELGLDTGFSSRGEVFDERVYAELASHKRVVAIGECGLDYFRLEEDRTAQLQKDVLEAHVRVARAVNKPLMCHCRPSKDSQDVYDELHEIMASRMSDVPAAISHFFVGNVTSAKKLLNLGFYFTFGGVITFARDYDEVIASIPIDRILLETDAPYVTPAPHRGKRNEPGYVIEVYKKMAQLKNMDEQTLREKIFENNKRVFGLNI